MLRSRGLLGPLKPFLIAGLALGVAGCGSTIHTQSQVADVNTLSLDAKQRLVLVANRQAGKGERVTCTEPMPDAIVARAAVLSGSGSFPLSGGAGTASGGASGGTSESAASIGFRNETVQMLRDGYYRLCEAYMNGALNKRHYRAMITNADTFMVVISALQTLGDNPIAAPVGITTGTPSTTAAPASGGAPGVQISGGNVSFPPASVVATPRGYKDQSAQMAAQIVRDYLKYRYALNMAIAKQDAIAEREERQERQKARSYRN